MYVQKFLGRRLEMDVESYIEGETTRLTPDGMVVGVVGPKEYERTLVLDMAQREELLKSFSSKGIEELIGRSVYALYEDHRLIGISKINRA